MKIVKVKIDSVIENPDNPRQIGEKEFRKLVESIKKFPQMLSIRPIVVNDAMIVLGGNMRLRACKEAGLKEIPIIKADDLTPEQEQEFIIRDNVNMGVWDWDKLANDFDLDQLSEWGLEVLIEDKEEVQEDDFDVEGNIPESPVVKLGDLIELGSHRVLCGDSTSSDGFKILMNKELGEACISDPPYGVDYVGKTSEALTIQGDKNADVAVSGIKNTLNFIKDGGAIYICFPAEELLALALMWESPARLQSMLVWVKNTIVMGRKDYNYKHEPIWYGWKEGAAHRFKGTAKSNTVLECDKPSRNGEHPTMKPITLMADIIRNSTSKHEIILDPFLGSGTTLIACEQLDRLCYGIELNPKYCDVIVKRYKQYCIENNKEFTCKINDVDSANLF